MNAPLFIKSIRVRLLLWLAFLLACVLTGFGVTAYQLHRINRFESIDEELESRVAALTQELRPRMGPGRFRGPPPMDGSLDGLLDGPPDKPPERPGDRSPERGFDAPPNHPGERRLQRFMAPPKGFLDNRLEGRDFTLSPATLSLFEDASPDGFYFVIWSRSGSSFRRSTNAPPESLLSLPAEADSKVQTRTRDGFREAFELNSIGECILTGRRIAADLAGLRNFAWWLVAAGFAVLTLGCGGGWILTTRAIRPIEDIGAAARRIADGNLSERINVADTDNELGRLAGVLNSTFSRLEAAFAQQKQFTADASHELRTPIAVIIAEAQTTLARERSAADYRETVETCLDAAQQMRRLTQSLLELARFDAGQERLECTRFDLSERLQACLHLVRPLAQPRGITLEADLGSIEAHGDPDRLCQVFTNLLTNAVHYNRDHGSVRVVASTEPEAVVVSVTDTGQGIAPEDLPHLFERFYRGDKARRSASGQSGLGLAIAKAIVDAHRGSLEAVSKPGSGSTFTVRIPFGCNNSQVVTVS